MDNKFKTKRYDLYWIEKQKHELKELRRVVEKAGLESELIPFNKGIADFHEDAVNWFEVRGIKVDSQEDIKKPKKDSAPAIEVIKKSSKKSLKNTIPSIGIDED